MGDLLQRLSRTPQRGDPNREVGAFGPAASSIPAARRRRHSCGATGSQTWNEAPWPGVLSTSSVPP